MTRLTTESHARITRSVKAVRERQQAHEMFIEALAPPEQIESLRRAARTELGASLPEGYGAFLEVSDGLDWNGAVIYGSTRKDETPTRPFLEGFVEGNQALRDTEALRSVLVLGESGMELFIYDPQAETGGFRIIDRVSLDTYESFDSFDDLLTSILSSRL